MKPFIKIALIALPVVVLAAWWFTKGTGLTSNEAANAIASNTDQAAQQPLDTYVAPARTFKGVFTERVFDKDGRTQLKMKLGAETKWVYQNSDLGDRFLLSDITERKAIVLDLFHNKQIEIDITELGLPETRVANLKEVEFKVLTAKERLALANAESKEGAAMPALNKPVPLKASKPTVEFAVPIGESQPMPPGMGPKPVR